MTDESRLLTDKEISINWDTIIGYPCLQKRITKSELESLLKAQDAKTASIEDAEIERLKQLLIITEEAGLSLRKMTEIIKEAECQYRIEKIFKEIEKHFIQVGDPFLPKYLGISKLSWQTIREQEGIE